MTDTPEPGAASVAERERIAAAIANMSPEDFRRWTAAHSDYPNCYKSSVDRIYEQTDRILALTPTFSTGAEVERLREAWTQDMIDSACDAENRKVRSGDWGWHTSRVATLAPIAAEPARGDADDWTGGRAWPDLLEHVAAYWAEWEEDRAGRGTFSAEELAEDAGEFATGLADYLAKRAAPKPNAGQAAEGVGSRHVALCEMIAADEECEAEHPGFMDGR